MGKKFLVGFFLSVATIFSLRCPARAELKFTWGPYWRIRHEYWKNWKDMDNGQLDNRNFFRIKTSLWGQADYNKDISLYARFTNEFKAYTYFGGTTASVPDKSAGKKGYHFDINEVVFDNLYAEVRNVLDLPVDVRLGRQDFLGTYGEGFLIRDGTPQDGSRTYYFNAAKVSWRVSEQNTLDFVYINDPRDEEFLPVINRVKLVNVANPTLDKAAQLLNTTDEQGYVLYLKNRSFRNTSLEPFYIYKYEAEEGGTGYQSQKGRLHTLGSFARHDFSPWALRAQLASQFGHYDSIDRRAMGGYVYLDRAFKGLIWSPQASAGFIYLSGDKRRTPDKNEGWDPLFSRYPWLSELYTLSIAAETGITGYWTNMQISRAELSLKPSAKVKIWLWYNYLRANAQVAESGIFSGRGRERGHLPQAKIEYTFNQNVSAYFLAEYFIPGSFYRDRDGAVFLRTELQIKY